MESGVDVGGVEEIRHRMGRIRRLVNILLKKSKRVLFISDCHTGHKFGLTPPESWKASEDDKLAAMQREAYTEYASMVSRHGPYNCVVLAGDMIDGDGNKSGASELITSDRTKQVDMAVANLDVVKRHAVRDCRWFAVCGTGYHTGTAEDFESLMARDKVLNVNMDFGAHTWIEVNGYTFDVKHHCGRSALPHGKYTPIARDALWSEIWSAHGGQPHSNAIVRGHTHYLAYCGDAYIMGITLPCLTWGSKFGTRRCSEEIHWGLVWCDVDANGKAHWDWETKVLEAQKARKVRV